MRVQLDAEQLAHLAVEVSEPGLRTTQDADVYIAQCGESFSKQAQRHGLARARRPADQRKTTLADELLDTPAERLDACGYLQRLGVYVGGERAPLQTIERQPLLGHGLSS